MVEGKLFEGIYSEKDGIRRNVGFVKACKIDNNWYIKVNIKGLYDVQDWIDVNYLVTTDRKDYSFQLGKMEIVKGIGDAEFVLSTGSFLPDYGFEQAVGITFGDWKSSNVRAYWGVSEHLSIEPFITGKRAPKPRTVEENVSKQVQEGKLVAAQVAQQIMPREAPEREKLQTLEAKREQPVRGAALQAGAEKAGVLQFKEKKPANVPPAPIQAMKQPDVRLSQENQMQGFGSHKPFNSILDNLESMEMLDIFNDDEYVDCMEVTPQQLKEFVGLEENVANNSFLLHAFYKYHHILIARPNDARKENMVFIGAPGVYSNRERYLACLFGFRNFKRSHRSDYTNPNFGYWYAEIYI